MATTTTIVHPFTHTIRAYSRQLVREWNMLNGRFGPSKLNSSRCHALIEISQHPLLTLADLADLLRLDKSTTSRAVASLEKEGLIHLKKGSMDQRKKLLSLTEKGEKEVSQIHCFANEEVSHALELLSEEERTRVAEGLRLYAKSLERSRLQKAISLRPIERLDNEAMAQIITQVMTEYGAVGPGFSINDREVTSMFEAYQGPRSAFFVLEKKGVILGGGGIAPLSGGSEEVCELRKMYFLPKAPWYRYGKKIAPTLP